MFRTLRLICAIFSVLLLQASVSAATLQQLSLDQMSQGASAVVRARVISASASISGSTIYTHYKLSSSEVWKGAAPAEVMLPGGTANGQSESFPGVPELKVGGEYVLFLWTSRSTGITHVIGLSQGLFELSAQPDGSAVANRRASGEAMLDSEGRRVSDQAVSMKLADMKSRVRQAVNR